MNKVQPYTYHCHTNFSDGKNSLEEMVARAKEIGFTELGISDHLIVHKNTKQSKSYDYWLKFHNDSFMFYSDFKSILSKYQKHCDEIRRLSEKCGLKLYVGFEVDFFTYNGWFEEFIDFISKIDYDYLINGNHMFFDENCENFFDIYSARFLDLDEGLYQDYLRRHFATMKSAVESGVFKFLAHIDYARKLGDDICGPEHYIKEKNSVLDALAKNNVAIEISTKGLRKIGDFYPCEQIVDEIAKRQLTVVISDDAHSVYELGLNFPDAENLISSKNIKNRLKF